MTRDRVATFFTNFPITIDCLIQIGSNFQKIFLTLFQTTFPLTVWPNRKFIAMIFHLKLKFIRSSIENQLNKQSIINQPIKMEHFFLDIYGRYAFKILCFKFQVNWAKTDRDTSIQSQILFSCTIFFCVNRTFSL